MYIFLTLFLSYRKCKLPSSTLLPKVKSYGKIGLDIVTVFALPSIDEITDFVSGARHFVKGNPGFGTATLVLPFLPATAAGLLFLRRGGQNDEQIKLYDLMMT